MKTVLVKFNDNDLTDYFVNKVFNVGIYPKDIYMKCIGINILKHKNSR